MSPVLSIAASLSLAMRKAIGVEAVACTVPISHLVTTHQVNRKVIYSQGNKAQRSLNESFALTLTDDDVLFHLPVTKSLLYQLGCLHFKLQGYKIVRV